VNNAYAGVNTLLEITGKPFYDTPAAEIWDTMNRVGLRNHYLCTVYASK
jgi:dehydrogenase/reductase SDR family protein 1